MKKIYFILTTVCLSNFCLAQLTVSSFANTSTVCLGKSTSITASATPLTYNVTAIPNALIADYGIHILADPQGLTGMTPITRSAGVNQNDCRWDNIAIPFTFNYYGNPYTSVNVCANGWVGLGSTNSTTTGVGFLLPNASAPNNTIHGVNANLTFVTAGVLEYFTDGVAPNRTFVVSYQNVPFNSGGGITTFQIHLKETSNIIEIHTTACTNTTLPKAQGVENAAGDVAAVVTGRNNTTDWTSTGYTNGYRFTPDVINFSWSPASSLSSATGSVVTATPTITTIYTITATNASNGATGSNMVTITVDPASNTLAAIAGGATVFQNASVNATGSTYYRDGNCNLIASITPTGATPVSNVINTSIKIDTGATKRGSSSLYVARKYDIEPQSYPYPTPATASITLYYLQSEFNNYNLKATDSGHKNLPTGSADATGISNLVLRQFHGTGTNPSNYTGPSQDFTTATSGFTVIWNSTRNWWEVTVPVTGFSGFYITSTLTNVLPITLEYFNGTQNDNKHLLSWKVNSTSDKNIFEVQRSADGIHFLSLTTVNATQAQCYQPFSIIDDKPLDGTNYYRLKISSTDDKTSFSNIVQLTLKTKNLQIISISPNPAKEENVTLKINTGEKSQVNINIADFTGRVLSKQTVQLTPGINKVILNSKTLTAGAYLVTVYSFNQTAKTVRLIKQ